MLLEALLLIGAVISVDLIGLHGVQLLIAYGVIIVFCILLLIQNRRLAPPFIPTSMNVVDMMMRLAEVAKGDLVYDIGCGDGRLLIAAAKKGARAIGYEHSVPTLQKGTRVISHSFTMPTVNIAKREGNAVLYVKM